MSENVNFRSFEEGDYEMCCEWWKWWDKSFEGKGIDRLLLPKDERCYVIEKNNVPVACTFLLLSLDVPHIAWTTHLVSNPKYKEKDRRDLLKLLVKKVEIQAKKYGVLELFTICGDHHMANIHASLDWTMTPAEYEAVKYL